MREGGTEKTGLHARGGDGGSGKLESDGVRGERRYCRVGERRLGFKPVL